MRSKRHCIPEERIICVTTKWGIFHKAAMCQERPGNDSTFWEEQKLTERWSFKTGETSSGPCDHSDHARGEIWEIIITAHLPLFQQTTV